MLLLLVTVAAAVHRYHTAMVANDYNRCRSLLDIDGNAASGVHLHMGLPAVMLAEKRHLDRLAEEISSANLSRCLFSASMTACSRSCK